MRIRSIKPGFFTDYEIGELHPQARLLFIGLWCEADKSGRLKDRPQELKIKLLPYDEVSADGLLDALHQKKFIFRYEIDGQKVIQIRNWEKHQKPHPKEQDSLLPAIHISSRGKKRLAVEKNGETGTSRVDPCLLSLVSGSGDPPLPPLGGSSSVVISIKQKRESAKKLLSLMNELAGTKFRLIETNIKLFESRLKDSNEDDIAKTLRHRWSVWGGTDMQQHFNPETFCRAKKFEKYLAEAMSSAKPTEQAGNTVYSKDALARGGYFNE